MKVGELSPSTQEFIRETAIRRGLSEEQVIDNFYRIFRRRGMSRHSVGGLPAANKDGTYRTIFC